ncbi:MAG: hypothetical protein ACOCQD_00190 [archaeon]
MKILWLSRHQPTNEQTRRLNRIFTGVTIVNHPYSVDSGQEIKNLMEQYNCQEIVAVLPINLIKELTDLGIHPIKAEMERVMDYDDLTVDFKFKRFIRIKDVHIDYEVVG